MNQKVVIIGAGLSGLIASRMLSDRKPEVIEKQTELPNNHEAILRFRSDAVSMATNIPFRKVHVTKAVARGDNLICDSIRYSLKVTGKLQTRSVMDLQPVERWIAPRDFIARLGRQANISYGQDFEQYTNEIWKSDRPAIVSTLPMPYMMKLFGWEPVNFTYNAGWTARFKIMPEYECRLNCTMYFPGNEPWYRVSITDDELIVEGQGEGLESINLANRDIERLLLNPFGLSHKHFSSQVVRVKKAKYQKIGELSVKDREQAKRFIMHLTEKHNIYSLGRFATWRPKVLLDDIVQDVQVISRLIDGTGQYEARMK